MGVSPALHYCGLFPENDDVKERKLATNETNSIGSKRAKRKQKAHNGDYFSVALEGAILITTLYLVAQYLGSPLAACVT